MPKKIFIIDDEMDLVETLSFRLKASGYDVDSASNGKTGLEKIEVEKPDLILLDLMMPGIDGYEVCKRLKDNKDLKKIPVIMLTAKGQDSDVDLGKSMGADDYITKPFEASELMEKIKNFLSK